MDKTMRIQSTSPIIKNGFMLIPTFAPWLDAYLHELLIFPNGTYNDQVDSTSQALHWWSQGRGSSWIEELARDHKKLTTANGDSSTERNTPPTAPVAPWEISNTCGQCGNRELERWRVEGVSGDINESCNCGWSRIIRQPAKVRTAATVRTPGFTD